jgi:hypothetical protein
MNDKSALFRLQRFMAHDIDQTMNHMLKGVEVVV